MSRLLLIRLSAKLRKSHSASATVYNWVYADCDLEYSECNCLSRTINVLEPDVITCCGNDRLYNSMYRILGSACHKLSLTDTKNIVNSERSTIYIENLGYNILIFKQLDIYYSMLTDFINAKKYEDIFSFLNFLLPMTNHPNLFRILYLTHLFIQRYDNTVSKQIAINLYRVQRVCEEKYPKHKYQYPFSLNGMIIQLKPRPQN